MSEGTNRRSGQYGVTVLAAERILVFKPARGRARRITVRLGVPRRDRKQVNGDWVCPYEITGFAQPRRRWAFGIDGVQALSLAFHIIPAELGRLAHQGGGGRFEFLGEDGISFADGCALLLNHMLDATVERPSSPKPPPKRHRS